MRRPVNVEQSIEYYFRDEWNRVQNDEAEYQLASYKVKTKR
jgi:hypothetical protein